MNATCPHCGTHGSLETFLADADAKAAVVAVSALPGDLPRLVWSYLGLFRKPGSSRVLTWQRVGRVVTELAALVAEPETQWKSGRVVPNAPRFWAEAIQTVLDKDAIGKLERPLDGHNYLRAVAYDIAEKAWHQGNVAREDSARHRPPPVRHCEGLPRSNPGTDWIATGRSAPTQSLASRNDGEEYQPVPVSEVKNMLKQMREKLNGGPQ